MDLLRTLWALFWIFWLKAIKSFQKESFRSSGWKKGSIAPGATTSCSVSFLIIRFPPANDLFQFCIPSSSWKSCFSRRKHKLFATQRCVCFEIVVCDEKTKVFCFILLYKIADSSLKRLFLWCSQLVELRKTSMSTSTRWRFALGSNFERSCLIVPRMAACVWRISANFCFCSLSSAATSSCKTSSCRQKKSVGLQHESHLNNLTIHGILSQVPRTERSRSRRVFGPLEMRLLSRLHSRNRDASVLPNGDRWPTSPAPHSTWAPPNQLSQAALSRCMFCEPTRYDIVLHPYRNTLQSPSCRPMLLVRESVDPVDAIVRATVRALLLVPVTQKSIARLPTHTNKLEKVEHSVRVYQQSRLPWEATSLPSRSIVIESCWCAEKLSLRGTPFGQVQMMATLIVFFPP